MPSAIKEKRGLKDQAGSGVSPAVTSVTLLPRRNDKMLKENKAAWKGETGVILLSRNSHFPHLSGFP